MAGAAEEGGPSLASLPEAPTFFPTLEEFADPLKYIHDVVRPAAELQAGIAKIVPPDGWAPPFALDRSSLSFRTRLQRVDQLQSKDTSLAARAFWDGYGAFQAERGTRHRKNPTFGGQEVDLYRLYRLVSRRGDYQTVTDDKGWRDIANILGVSARGGRRLGGGRMGAAAPALTPPPTRPHAPVRSSRTSPGAPPTACASSTPSCCSPTRSTARGGMRAATTCWVSCPRGCGAESGLGRARRLAGATRRAHQGAGHRLAIAPPHADACCA